jgi:hypothetical protein
MFMLLSHASILKQNQMKRINYLFIGTLLMLIMVTGSCKKAEPKTEEPVAVEVNPYEGPIPSVSYKGMMVKYSVTSYPKWKEAYLGNETYRNTFGITSGFIGRGTEDTSTAIVFNKMEDLQKAKDFGASPKLKAAMDKAGLTSPPIVAFLDVIRDDTSSIPENNRVIVAHRVKDFDAWLKVYDSEGRAVRAANGLLDRGLARELEDPAMVYIVFAVTDKEKAMARTQSEELKKLMTEAGVEGAPRLYFYTLEK